MSTASDEDYPRWAGAEGQDSWSGAYRNYGRAATPTHGVVEPEWARQDDRDRDGRDWRSSTEPASYERREDAALNPYGGYDAGRADESARALLADARERVDRAIAAVATESGRFEAERARIEQRAGEAERHRLEAQRQQEALDMVLRRTEERLIASERAVQNKDEEISELHRRLAATEARAAESDREREDAGAAAQLRIEEIEAQADTRVDAARNEAAQAIEDARAEAAAEIERAKEELAPETHRLKAELEAMEHRAEAAEVAGEAAEQAAEAAAANGASLREEADRLRKRVEERVKELEKTLADSQTEIKQLKEWRAKTIERLRSAGLLRSGGQAA